MNAVGHSGRPASQRWPDAAQTLLLKAALGEPGVARAAWEEWYPDTDIDSLDYDCHRIFPLLYRNLVALGIECPDLQRLKGVYRHYWYRNQLLLKDAKTALEALREHRVDTLVLKGLALTAVHYRDDGARPFDDIDILVRPADAPRAVDVVRGLGYVPELGGPLEIQMRREYSLDMRNEAGRMLDLHWYSLAQSGDDEDLWSASLPVTIGGVQTRTLCPADQLLHACVHGISGYAPAAMRWLADAVTVIRTSGDQLDWERLVDRATARSCTVVLADALAHLDGHVIVPGSVIDRLRAAPASRVERLAHRAAVRPFAHGNRYAFDWYRYRRLREASAPGVQPNFAAYMLERWNLNSYHQLALRLALKAWQVARYGHSEPGERIPAGAAR